MLVSTGSKAVKRLSRPTWILIAGIPNVHRVYFLGWFVLYGPVTRPTGSFSLIPGSGNELPASKCAKLWQHLRSSEFAVGSDMPKRFC